MTQVRNGKWYSLRNDRIYKHRKLLGQIYQNELARQVKRLGYYIEPKAHGQFEIAGFTREQLEQVSKRRRQICRQLSEDSTWAEREVVWQTTRARKGDPIPRQELQDVWTHELDALGIQWPQRERRSPSELNRDEELRKAIADGIEHCSERNVAFPTEDIEQFVLAEVGAFELSEIERAIAESNELIYLDEQVTTETAVRRELAAIWLMRQGQGEVEAIADETALASNEDLTEGQRQAIALAVSTTDRAIAWQGVAGSGKTRALAEVRAIAESQGYVVRGFAPSAEAAKGLGDAVGIPSATVASLLFSPLPEPPVANQIWAIDEAGLLSAKDALALLQRAEREGARAIWVGDTRQLSAVEAGNPFKSLQQAGMRTAYLDESRRQKTPELQRAVSLVVRGRIRDGIDQLQQAGCIEIEADEARRQARLVGDYLALSPAERDRTLVLAGTNRERLELTQQIRSGLRGEGALGQGTEIARLKARDLTDVQSRYAHHFVLGDVVMPLYRNRRRGLERGALYEVAGKEGDRLLLQSEDGTRTSADLHFKKVVFSREQIEIAPGDLLRWTKNDRDLGHRNGQQFWVESIEDGIARVQYANGLFEAIDLSRPQHLDYALVSTTYAAQGKTAERVLMAADRTASKESFYVAVSRVKHELKIYAADLDQLATLAERSRANQNPVELLRQHANREWTAEVGREIEPTTKPKPADRDCSPTSTDKPERPPKPLWKQRVQHRDEGDREVGIANAPTLDPHHFNELHRDSAIAADLISLNFKSVRGEETYRRVCYSEQLARTRNGTLSDRVRQRYAHLTEGGWWCGGLDPLDTWRPMQWGCFKPDRPRLSPEKGKPIKYEHPVKTPTRVFVLDVPERIWEKVARSYGLAMPHDRRAGFWTWVQRERVPIVLVEGAKKAASLISAGYAAIALPGIWNGRRKAANGKPERLIPELQTFVSQGREVRFCFDRDEKPKTRKNVQDAIWKTGRLFQQQGCQVGIIELPGPEKGIDDFIVARGASAFEAVYAEVMSYQEWNAKRRRDRPQLLADIEATKRQNAAAFEPPAQNETLWPRVRRELIERQTLPPTIVDRLRNTAQLYASGSQSPLVIFVRRNFTGEIVGASRVSLDGRVQSLSPIARQDAGWFYFSMGAGQSIDRVVVASSPTDAIALAAMARTDVKTLYVAAEHPDRIPMQLLRGAIAKQKPVFVARGSGAESDRVVSAVVRSFPEVTRIRVPQLNERQARVGYRRALETATVETSRSRRR